MEQVQAATGDAAAETTAAEIRAELARQRITQSDLARRLGVTRAWIVRRLTGDTQITVADLAIIANELDVPPEQLLRQG